MSTNKKKDPIKAVYLNLLLPGLGCLYLEKWGTAILFFVLTPLRLLAGTILLLAIASMLRETAPFVSWAVLPASYLWWAVVYKEVIYIPYQLATEINQKITADLGGEALHLQTHD